MTQIKLEKNQFDGPLDLLLSLIEDKKLKITEIALAEVTEQFLAHVRSLEAASPVVLADFLAVAAKLLVIKSRAILPELISSVEDEIDPARDLEGQLVLYKQFKDLAKGLKKLSDSPTTSFLRSAVFSERVSFFPDSTVTPPLLRDALSRIMQNLADLEELPKARIREAISIQDKISHLQNVLSEKIETSLSHLLSKAKTKHEAIVTFLALLELIKQRILSVEQETAFADVTIRRIEMQDNPMVEL